MLYLFLQNDVQTLQNPCRSLIKQSLMWTSFVGEVTQSTNSRRLASDYFNKSVDSVLALAYISYNFTNDVARVVTINKITEGKYSSFVKFVR